MRTVAIILTVIFFFGCLAVGILISERLPISAGDSLTSSPTLPVQGVSASYQYNLLVVRVDSLQAETPVLRSTWGVLASLQQPAGLAFVPLYPVGDGELRRKMEQSFALYDRSRLTSGFFETIQDAFDLQFATFFIIDDSGATWTTDWINARLGTMLSTTENPEDIFSSEVAVFEAACQALRENSSALNAPFIWNELFPSHAYTNMAFQTTMSYWSTLTHPSSVVTCEVFQDPSSDQ